MQLSLAHEDFFDEILSHTLAALRARVTLSPARSASQALQLLASPDLAGVFVTDSGISDPKNAALLAQFVAYVKAGGTVVIGGAFSSFMSVPDMNAFFRKGWGLPWKMSSYHRTTFSLNRRNTLASASPALQQSYSMKAVHLSDVPVVAALYLPSEDSRVESMVFAPTQITKLTEAPVVFAEVGSGRLGYVGDVNSEKGSTEAIVAMFGL
ncbi:hypothetical protein DFH06DRAFT_968689 [Mycena polygramma]|nr:hypothetical protein DFH06DRAFT_968689 [Mycena polygramma]